MTRTTPNRAAKPLRHHDGHVSDWTADTAVGTIVAPTLSEAKAGMLKQLRANLGFAVHFDDVRGLRSHLVNSTIGCVVGVLSGFDLEQVAQTGVSVKYHGEDVS
jgi:hypothetical protein